MQRRSFLRQSSKYSLGFLGLQMFSNGCRSQVTETASFPQTGSEMLHPGYGKLADDPEGILRLPPGFSYDIISRQGDLMSDGLLVPGAADGMATFSGPDGKTIIIRNHEVSPADTKRGAFGEHLDLLSKLQPQQLYDYGRGELPCLGGTTTMVYNPVSGQIETEYLSLAGTIRNCAGGLTPWDSWVSCEENVSNANDALEKNHGYNFEVPANHNIAIATPRPLVQMGRFNHEAICVDPRTSIVYQTEDRGDGLIYRYLPHKAGDLHSGGRLQVLGIAGMPSFDTRNWAELITEKMEIGKKYQVQWYDIDGVDTENDDLRYRGYELGAARFARGEGMWYGKDELYFACTNGGHLEYGQIFRYRPSATEGQDSELDAPGTLELFIEPNNIDLISNCDNLTISGGGDLVICEDREHPRIVGVTPNGQIYHIAENTGFRSEFAGATFSPDGNILFVNIQGPGLTLAIKGPWSSREEIPT